MISALLCLCEGNPPINHSSQRTSHAKLWYFVAVCMNKLLEKQLQIMSDDMALKWGHCNCFAAAFVVISSLPDRFMWSLNPHPSGVLDWHWGYRMTVTDASEETLKDVVKIDQWPASLTIFFARNSNAMETSPRCNSVAGHQLASIFAHATTAQLSHHVNSCNDHCIRIEVIVKISIEFELL